MASEIIVSINVQSGKAEVNLGKAKKGVDKLAAAEKRLADANADGAIKIAELNLRTKERIQLNNQAAAETLKNVNKGSGQFRTQVGLNNAILTEAGRAASDLRFGFNGVANNVGQIASLFGNLINTSDNVLTSLKNLAKSLMGTGGVMIAIQLLIAYGDQIYNFFRGISESAAKTEKAFKKLEGTIASQRKELEGYLVVLQDTSVSEEVRANALNELNVIGEDVIDSYKNQKISQEELTLSVEHYMKQQRLRAQLDAIISSNADLFAEKERIDRVQGLLDEEKTLEGRKKIYNENTNLIEKFLNATNVEVFKATGGKGYLKRWLDGDDKTKDFATVFRTATAGTVKEAKAIIEQLIDIESQLEFKGKEKTGGGSGRDTREFKEKLFDIQSIVDKFNKEADKLNVRTLDERIDLEEKYAKISADSKLNRFIQTQSKRLEEYKEQVKDDKNAKELIKNAENDFNGSIVDAKIKHGLAIASIEEGFISKRILAKDKEAEKLGKIARKLENNEIDRLKFSLDANETFFNQKIKQAEGDKQDADDRILRAEQLKLSEVEIAQAKAQSIGLQNTLIDLNLAKEQAAADEKQRINTEYLGFVSGVGGILKTIAGENEALQTAALVLEKGAAIANIVIKTQAGNQAARALALANPIGVREAYMATTEAQVLRNNIGAGISIASILATSLTSAKSPSGGANGGGGANVTAPSFNVVGASATNQLAQTVAGQVNAPLRAYVVGSDISDQQELDRSIISTAGIG
jgi:hypothetical protein